MRCILFIFTLTCINSFLYCQCESSVIINTPYYSETLTQSNSYIMISSSVDSYAIVRLDADPVGGYVLMSPGFESIPNGDNTFIAQTLDGCNSQVPLKMNNIEENNSISYSNPVDVSLKISSGFTIKEIIIYNMMGDLVYQMKKRFRDETIDLSQLSQGVYILFLKTENDILYSKKIIKK